MVFDRKCSSLIFWGVTLGELILRHTDSLSRTLRKADISAAESQKVAGLTKKTLQSLRTDSNFQLFWEKITREADQLEINEPSLPRRRKLLGDLKVVAQMDTVFQTLQRSITGKSTMKPLI